MNEWTRGICGKKAKAQTVSFGKEEKAKRDRAYKALMARTTAREKKIKPPRKYAQPAVKYNGLSPDEV